ncbi:MAG TPA: SpoIIE family protein phosphatase [Rectinemataceae bacterium]|nr:SpoIIE family protein phosphatase [Rectinemataceae bacterium]
MDAKKRVILLVDDQEGIVNALKRELRDWAAERSLETLTSLSAKEGLEILESRGNDTIIVVSDLHMPEMKGAEFLERVRLAHPDIVSILMTGNSDLDEIAKAVGAGIFGFIPKPWESAFLVAEVQKAFEFGDARREIAAYHKTVEDELKLAGALQKAILKPGLPVSDGVRFGLSYQPVSNLYCGGDYYDVILLAPKRYLLLLGDVEGHGVKAAFVTGILKAIIYSEYVRALDGRAFSPGGFLGWLNERLHFEFKSVPSLIVTFFAGVLDLPTRSFRYANAGQNHPLVLREGKAIELTASGQAIGLSDSASYVEEVAGLEPGDLLLLFTDGLVEIDCSGGCAPVEMRAIVERVAYGEDYHRRLLEAALAESGSPSFTDDVTILSARIL